MELFTLVTENTSIKNPSFSLIKSYFNEDLICEFKTEYAEILHAVSLDFHRVDVYIGEDKANSLADVLCYISTQPYLKAGQVLVYLMMSQIALSIPAILITQIIGNIDQDLVTSENKKGGRIVVEIKSHTIMIQKKLRAVVVAADGEVETKMEFDISFDMDLAVGETLLHIKGVSC